MYSPNGPFILVDSELYLIFPFICFYFTSYLYCVVWPIEDELPHTVYPYVFGIALHLGSTYIGPLMSMETNVQGNVENACINMMWQHALKSCVMINALGLSNFIELKWMKVDEWRWLSMFHLFVFETEFRLFYATKLKLWFIAFFSSDCEYSCLSLRALKLVICLDSRPSLFMTISICNSAYEQLKMFH